MITEWNNILEKQPREGMEVLVSVNRRSTSTVVPYTQCIRYCTTSGATKGGSINIHDLVNGCVHEDMWDSFFDLGVYELDKYSRFVRGHIIETITHWALLTPPQKQL